MVSCVSMLCFFLGYILHSVFFQWPDKYYMVVWGLSNFTGLATIPGQQEIGSVVVPSHVNWEDVMV